MDGCNSAIAQVQEDSQAVVSTTADEINNEYRLACDAAESAVDHAIRLGDLLVKHKRRLKHGEFKPWIEEFCNFSYPSAARYMTLARLSKKYHARDFSSVAQALDAAKNERPETWSPKPLPPMSRPERMTAEQRWTFERLGVQLVAFDRNLTGLDPVAVIRGINEEERKPMRTVLRRLLTFLIRLKFAENGSDWGIRSEVSDEEVDQEITRIEGYVCPQSTVANGTVMQ